MVMAEFNDKNWCFVNMNSPADLDVNWINSNTVLVEEYDRCRDGHCLLSEFFVNTSQFKMSTTIEKFDDGAAAGLYFGDGCWEKYLGIFVSHKGFEIRIPSGVPQGDTFRYEGPKRHYVLSSKDMPLSAPFVLTIEAFSDSIHIYKDDKVVLKISTQNIYFLRTNGRVFLKAVNEKGKYAKSIAVFKDIELTGEAVGYPIRGRVLDADNNPLQDASVHVMGMKNKWALTKEDGSFVIEGLPCDDYTLVVAKENRCFMTFAVKHATEEQLLVMSKETETPRNEDPRVRVARKYPWESLNGVWSFDFDKENKGMDEQWYKINEHRYSKNIRVPFSWTSLSGFGEESSAKDSELHQFNTFHANIEITGAIGWYKRTIKIPDAFSNARTTVLHIGAISGLAQVWLDGNFLGESIYQYNNVSWNLGRLEPGTQHDLVIRVDADYNEYHLCSGKQGFWFSQCPGIWQSVWLENCDDVYVKELFAITKFEDGNLDTAKITLTALCDVLPETKSKLNNYPGFTLTRGVKKEVVVNVPCSGVYLLKMEYGAGLGLSSLKIETNTNSIKTVFHGTPNFQCTDVKIIYLNLVKGNNTVGFLITPDERMDHKAYCEIKKLEVHNVIEPDSMEIIVHDPQNKCIYNKTTKPVVLPMGGNYGVELKFILNKPQLWDIDSPILYKVKSLMKRDGKILDEASSTFGIRQISTDWASGHGPQECSLPEQYQQVHLNDKVIYIRGVLDQGYNPWGSYTYPYGFDPIPGSINFDIEASDKCGYNLIRVHIKDNEPLFYSLCDKKGMLVWDELPPNFYEKAMNPSWRGMYFRQLDSMALKHHYHPSVVIFSAINESWGVEGWHERSPWDDEFGQKFIKCAAKTYKKSNPQVLVIDNSGYGKTGVTDIIDHHCYPLGYSKSKSFWHRLAACDFPGSTFNFYNVRNKDLMKNKDIRDLLQKNCSQPLHSLEYKGEEYQSGQPIIVSEFVHTNRNIRLLRMINKISGYVRMNLASQENEDTSPLTAMRKWREFGYLRSDLSVAGYNYNNSINSVIIDSPSPRQVSSGETLRINLYGSVWDHKTPLENTYIRWVIAGIDVKGNIMPHYSEGIIPCTVKRYEPSMMGTLLLDIPYGLKGMYLFAELCVGKRVLAEDSVQFEIFGEEYCGEYIDLTQPSQVVTDGFFDIFNENNRRLFWLSKKGYVDYYFNLTESVKELNTEIENKMYLSFEASTCECLNGTRVTDETLCQGKLEIDIDHVRAGEVILSDHPSDERALFSNSATIIDEFFYEKSGRYGYGEKFTLQLPEHIVKEIINRALMNQPIKITFRTAGNGIVLYGNRMGRYGFDPFIEIK